MSSLLPIFLCLLTTAVVNALNDTYDYGSVIDAGSTHSQLHVYRWLHREVTNVSNILGPLDSKPFRISSSLSIDPISTLTTQEETDALLSNLSWYAKQTLASEEYRWSQFPIYLKATAGMRVLDIIEREHILSMIQTYYMSDENPFLFDESQAIIAAGEEESMFDWLTVNFLADKLNGKPNETYGALDMGGRSTQIAFAAQPSYDILAQFSVVRLWQETYRLYTNSFLTFGTDAIEEKVALQSYSNGNNNPCLNRGYSATYDLDVDGNITNMVQNGTGDAVLCMQYLTDSLLLDDTECFTKSCSINGVYQPLISNDMIFIAFSAYGYFVGDCGLAMNVSIEEMYDVTLELCNMTYDELYSSQMCGGGSNSYVWTYCRIGTYFRVLLHDAFGFGLQTHNIWFTNSLGSVDANLDWTQGSILRDSNWLPFGIDLGNSDSGSGNSSGGSASVVVVNDNNSLSDEGKAYQVSTFVLMSVLIIMCGLIIYRMWKNRGDDEERLSYNFI